MVTRTSTPFRGRSAITTIRTSPRQNATPDVAFPQPSKKRVNPMSAVPTTMWIHDHAMDVTGFNVNRGLAAFYLCEYDVEIDHRMSGRLPKVYGDFDHVIALKDFAFNSDGTLKYDFLDHNGHLNMSLQPTVACSHTWRCTARSTASILGMQLYVICVCA